jgi:hypothetical protein
MNRQPIAAIAAGAFDPANGAGKLSDAGVTSVRLPKTLTSIAADSFTGAGITTLLIPEAVKEKIDSNVLTDLASNAGRKSWKLRPA